jgi:hypothetical protein
MTDMSSMKILSDFCRILNYKGSWLEWVEKENKSSS